MYRWNDAHAGKHSTSLFYIIRNKTGLLFVKNSNPVFAFVMKKDLKYMMKKERINDNTIVKLEK